MLFFFLLIPSIDPLSAAPPILSLMSLPVCIFTSLHFKSSQCKAALHKSISSQHLWARHLPGVRWSPAVIIFSLCSSAGSKKLPPLSSAGSEEAWTQVGEKCWRIWNLAHRGKHLRHRSSYKCLTSFWLSLLNRLKTERFLLFNIYFGDSQAVIYQVSPVNRMLCAILCNLFLVLPVNESWTAIAVHAPLLYIPRFFWRNINNWTIAGIFGAHQSKSLQIQSKFLICQISHVYIWS